MAAFGDKSVLQAWLCQLRGWASEAGGWGDTLVASPACPCGHFSSCLSACLSAGLLVCLDVSQQFVCRPSNFLLAWHSVLPLHRAPVLQKFTSRPPGRSRSWLCSERRRHPSYVISAVTQIWMRRTLWGLWEEEANCPKGQGGLGGCWPAATLLFLLCLFNISTQGSLTLKTKGTPHAPTSLPSRNWLFAFRQVLALCPQYFAPRRFSCTWR